VKVTPFVAAAGGVLAVATFIGFLAWNARMIDPAAHSRVIANLSKLQELDSELDETMLKLRDGLLNNYDPLVATLNLVNAHKRDLQEGEHGIVRDGGAELETAMASVAAKLAEKEALFEQFKSENALLKNSFHYFPLSVERLLRAPQVPAEVHNPMQRLLRDVLLLRLGRRRRTTS
jgi:hypothetical protein